MPCEREAYRLLAVVGCGREVLPESGLKSTEERSLDSNGRNQPRIIIPHVSDRSTHFPRLHFLCRIRPEKVNRQMRWLIRSP
jgi:hypothetical protein